MPRRKTLKQFIEDAQKVHGDRYDYSNTEYKTNREQLSFVCKSCSKTITVTATNHLGGYGCKVCHPRFSRCGDLLTQETILEHFKKTHGDAYDYSKVVYLGAHKKVEITCRTCDHTFMQAARVHKRGSGCPKCDKTRKLSREEVIAMFEKIHNGKYDYSKVVLKNCSSKVEIICKTCNNTFWQEPAYHKQGSGCPYCANNQVLTRSEALRNFIDVHGYKYDYGLVKYKNSKTEVTIKCNTCGNIFDQKPVVHRRGSGCPKCANNMNYTQEQIIRYFIEVHGDRYDYSRVEYKNSKTKVEIGCNLCEQWFTQAPAEHKRGAGCPHCHSNSLMKQDVVLEQFRDTHGDDYNYSKVEYTGIDKKVTIICKRCENEFDQSPYHHRRGRGCPKCAMGKSERLFGECLESLGLHAEKIRPDWLVNPETGYKLELDYYIEEINVAFEIQGKQHYEPMEHWNGVEGFIRQQRRDALKRKVCAERGIRLIEYDLRTGRDRFSMLQFIIEKIGYHILGK